MLHDDSPASRSSMYMFQMHIEPSVDEPGTLIPKATYT